MQLEIKITNKTFTSERDDDDNNNELQLAEDDQKTPPGDEAMTEFKLSEIKKNLRLRQSMERIPPKILNRRNKKLQELIEQGDYFSEEAIKHRQPILYQLYIGRYLSSGGDACTDFHSFLMRQCSNVRHNSKIKEFVRNNPEMKEHLESVAVQLRGEELEDTEDELIVLMHHRFMAGLDSEFIDYSKIDENPDYDDQREIDDDAQESYFLYGDAEDFSDGSYAKGVSEYTGELDY